MKAMIVNVEKRKIGMKTMISHLLLRLLNTHWLNPSPCRYGYIGNVDAFDIENLRSEVKMRPDLTVAQLLAEAERFMACPIPEGGRLVTMEADGSTHESTPADIELLKRSLDRGEKFH
jgi:hypothetical protein